MNAQTTAVSVKESMSAGPAPGRAESPAAAVPIVAKMPAPMIAPTPSATMFQGPSARFNRCSGSSVSATSASSDLVWKSLFATDKLPRRIARKWSRES